MDRGTPISSALATAGLHLCYSQYVAQGEGSTTLIAIARTPERARELLQENGPEYFAKEAITVPLQAGADDMAISMLDCVSKRVLATLSSRNLANAEFYCLFHHA